MVQGGFFSELFRDRRNTLGDSIERSRDIGFLTGVPLDFAAGGFGDRAGTEQHYVIKEDLVFLRYGPANRLDNIVRVRLSKSSINFLNDDHPFFICDCYRECSSASRAQQRMTTLDGVLDVLRVEIATTNND